MPLFISINIGFITNSSSAINHFPRQLLEHPEVAAFMKQMGIEEGFVGPNMWNRGACSTVAVTMSQKEEVVERLKWINEDVEDPSQHIKGPEVDTMTDTVLVIYGDEYDSVAASLSELLHQAAEEMGLSYDRDEYN